MKECLLMASSRISLLTLSLTMNSIEDGIAPNETLQFGDYCYSDLIVQLIGSINSCYQAYLALTNKKAIFICLSVSNTVYYIFWHCSQ